jgi:hypothetical protein
LAGFLELLAFFAFAPSSEDFSFVAKAHPLWGAWAAIVRVSAVVLILWAIVWLVFEHFTYASETFDILEANEGIAKAARSSRVESVQTSVAAAWIAAFTVAVFRLAVIGGGWVAFVLGSVLILVFCTVLWALRE